MNTTQFSDNTPDGKNRRFASFEISNDDRLVVAGSEHVGGDAFILFWDLRYNNARTDGKHELLGGYWESHMDDVTALSFHPDEMDILSSGSTDGLINVFDLKKTNEESALKYSLNTESSVVSTPVLFSVFFNFSIQLFIVDVWVGQLMAGWLILIVRAHF